MNVRAPTSFDCLRTVNGQITSSFRDAAEKLGLLAGDFIVEKSLNEAVLFQMPSRRVTNEILHGKNLPISEADLLAIHKLNACQRAAFKTITDAVLGNKPSAFFVDGPGGTGKTFLYRCLLAFVRSKGLIALATATSGIAASILPGGRTAHSRFKLPLDGTDKYVCNIGKHTADASLLRHSKLILWDEASMAHRNIVESLDITLKDIMDCQDLFGGKVIVFGGDFRQTLPVVRHGKKEDFIAVSLVKSTSIWLHICRLTLVENMRAQVDPTFASYLMKIGNGTEPAIYQNKIKVPSQFLVQKCGSKSSLYASSI
ncbi:ATP-dependent DNA helicase PIF2-like [Ipomoea triloba]|uniref:ATP-dependent DNA helicase PIF2-like n=1 Tax=Ipomoea triloba TaxID=35885 RepID=UPI00125DFAF5|nr:ATP-dependent DNA helicase PIF2-like [Ipomoea triloba]